MQPGEPSNRNAKWVSKKFVLPEGIEKSSVTRMDTGFFKTTLKKYRQKYRQMKKCLYFCCFEAP